MLTRTRISALCLLLSMGLATPAHARAGIEVPTKADGNAVLSFFRLPASLAGTPQHYVPVSSVSSGCMNPCSTEDFSSDKNGSSVAYGVRPNVPSLPDAATLQGEYVVNIFHSDTFAQQANATVKVGTRNYYGSNPAPLRVISRPLSDSEWLRTYEGPGNNGHKEPTCHAVGGVQYRGIVVIATVDNYRAIATPNTIACTAEAAWVLRMMSALYPRSIAFLARSFHAAPVLPTLTPAQQARNKALHLELAYWGNFTAPCNRDVMTLAQELSAHTYSSLDTLSGNGLYVEPECAEAVRAIYPSSPESAPGTPVPGYLVAPLLSDTNISTFLRLQDAVGRAMLADESFARAVGTYAQQARDAGPDLPHDVRQQLLAYIPGLKSAELHAQSVIQAIEREWRA